MPINIIDFFLINTDNEAGFQFTQDLGWAGHFLAGKDSISQEATIIIATITLYFHLFICKL